MLNDEKFRRVVSKNPDAVNTVCREQGLSAEQCRLFARGFQLVDKFMSTIEKPSSGATEEEPVVNISPTQIGGDEFTTPLEHQIQRSEPNLSRPLSDDEVETPHPRPPTIRPVNYFVAASANNGSIFSTPLSVGSRIGSRTWSTRRGGFNADLMRHGHQQRELGGGLERPNSGVGSIDEKRRRTNSSITTAGNLRTTAVLKANLSRPETKANSTRMTNPSTPRATAIPGSSITPRHSTTNVMKLMKDIVPEAEEYGDDDGSMTADEMLFEPVDDSRERRLRRSANIDYYDTLTTSITPQSENTVDEAGDDAVRGSNIGNNDARQAKETHAKVKQDGAIHIKHDCFQYLG